MSGGGHPNAVEGLELLLEEEFPWTLRLHDRSFMEYLVSVMVIRKKMENGPEIHLDAQDSGPDSESS